MTNEVIAIRVSPEQDPTSAALADILKAHLAYQRAKAARYLWIHVLAMVGVADGLCILVPGTFGAPVREAVFALWGACCVVVIGMVAAEWQWARRQARLLARLGTVDPGSSSS